MGEHAATIAIRCDCTPCHDWMAFAAWYSFRKVFPDCAISIDVKIDKPIFRWASVAGIVSKGGTHDYVFPPTVLALRDFEGDWRVSAAKSHEQSCLVDYSGGCGNFVVDEWINNNRAPFHRALKRFGTPDMTANEFAVLGLWEKCNDLYGFVGAR